MIRNAGMRNFLHVPLLHVTAGAVIRGLLVLPDIQRQRAALLAMAGHAFVPEIDRELLPAKAPREDRDS